MKKPFFAAILLLFCLGLSSCNKICHCYGYGGDHVYYTPEEVDEMYGTCSEMIQYGNGRFYSICEWDRD